MRPLRGIALKLASVLVFIVMASLIKATAQHVPAGQAVFFRSFFAIPVIVAWLVWRKELASGLKARTPMGHVWRGVVGTVAMGLWPEPLVRASLDAAGVLFQSAALR